MVSTGNGKIVHSGVQNGNMSCAGFSVQYCGGGVDKNLSVELLLTIRTVFVLNPLAFNASWCRRK